MTANLVITSRIGRGTVRMVQRAALFSAEGTFVGRVRITRIVF